MTPEQTRILRKVKEQPYILGHHLGFTKLTPLNNEWTKDMVFGKGDTTLQAHRGSYKTTCVALALFLIIILYPNDRTKFFRKTDNNAKEIVRQVTLMLKHSISRQIIRIIWGVDLKFITDSAFEIHTNLTSDPRGTSQLCASGIKASMTGQHFDRIFTDDIVTVDDRTSRAEREFTKMQYLELHNILNRGGRIYNTGTPWQKDDAFTIMPEPKKYDCYSTGLMSEAEIAQKKEELPPSLFAANYELRHIASEDVIFDSPSIGADPAMVMNSTYSHIDAAYGGEDWTVYTIVKKTQGKYYVLGKAWHKHIDECMDEIIALRKQFLIGKIWCETNGDKGYMAKELRKRGEKVVTYWEDTNKYYKIVSYLKFEWRNVVFVDGTDDDYLDMILDYNEYAEHDDAPDSLASLIRVLWAAKDEEKRITGHFA